MKELLYLDDLQPGMRYKTSTHTMDEKQIIEFARQFDPQPFHTDPVAAQQSLFGGLVASGWHTASITMKLLVENGAPLAGGLIGIEGQMAWPKPVRPGDTLRVESEVMEVTPSRSRPDRGIATMRSETLNQNGDIVQTMMAKLMVFRRK